MLATYSTNISEVEKLSIRRTLLLEPRLGTSLSSSSVHLGLVSIKEGLHCFFTCSSCIYIALIAPVSFPPKKNKLVDLLVTPRGGLSTILVSVWTLLAAAASAAAFRGWHIRIVSQLDKKEEIQKLQSRARTSSALSQDV